MTDKPAPAVKPLVTPEVFTQDIKDFLSQELGNLGAFTKDQAIILSDKTIARAQALAQHAGSPNFNELARNTANQVQHDIVQMKLQVSSEVLKTTQRTILATLAGARHLLGLL